MSSSVHSANQLRITTTAVQSSTPPVHVDIHTRRGGGEEEMTDTFFMAHQKPVVIVESTSKCIV